MNLSQVKNINSSIEVDRASNGYIVHVSYNDTNDNWKRSKVLIKDLEELVSFITKLHDIPLDD